MVPCLGLDSLTSHTGDGDDGIGPGHLQPLTPAIGPVREGGRESQSSFTKFLCMNHLLAEMSL